MEPFDFDHDNLLKSTEVADILKASRQCVYKIIWRGELRAVKLGMSIGVVEIALNKLISGYFRN